MANQVLLVFGPTQVTGRVIPGTWGDPGASVVVGREDDRWGFHELRCLTSGRVAFPRMHGASSSLPVPASSSSHALLTFASSACTPFFFSKDFFFTGT